MSNNMLTKILQFCNENKINLLDIDTIKITALKHQKYDIVVYLNNNSNKYISFAKNNDNN